MLRFCVALVLLQLVAGWKPVVGPSAYHISNHHPVMGTQNTLVESDGTATGATSPGHSITYHGNIFPQQEPSGHGIEPVSVILGNTAEDGDLGEGRVLSGFGENKFLEHGLTSLGVVGGQYSQYSDMSFAFEHSKCGMSNTNRKKNSLQINSMCRCRSGEVME